MIPVGYVEIWRAMSPEEKKAEGWRWAFDITGAFGLIGLVVIAFWLLGVASEVCRAKGYCA
jgi:hypothetical protein